MMFFKILLISFQMKIMIICSFDQTRLAKVSIFSEYKTNLSPSVCTCMTIKYGSKLVLFIRMRVPIYLIFSSPEPKAHR